MTESNKKWSWKLNFCREKKLDPNVASNWDKAESKFKQLMGKPTRKNNKNVKPTQQG